MDPELKKLLDQLKAAHEQFVAENDKRLKQIEARGSADAVTEEKVDKINAELSSLQTKIEEARRKADAAEVAANRPRVGGEGGPVDDAVHARAFYSLVRNVAPDSIQLGDADLEGYRAYKRAMNQYLRFGDKALTPDLRNAMSVGSDPNGGFFVTPDTNGRIVELIYETSPMRQVASAQTIGSDALEGPLDLDEFGAGWVGETETRTDTSTGKVGEYRIPAHEMYAMPKLTQKLLDDSQVDIEAWATRKIAGKLSRVENTAFVSGDGIKKPRGFLTYAAGTPSATAWSVIQQINTGANGAFAGTDPGDKLIDLAFALKAGYRGGATFMMSRSTVAAVRKLKDGQGNYLWTMSFEQRQGGLLIGYPIAEAEDMPIIASGTLSIAFGNFKEGYQIVDRTGIRILRDPYTAKPYIVLYTTRRVGGDVVNFEAIKLLKFSA
jgi:HK97 family phage major capsid protein